MNFLSICLRVLEICWTNIFIRKRFWECLICRAYLRFLFGEIVSRYWCRSIKPCLIRSLWDLAYEIYDIMYKLPTEIRFPSPILCLKNKSGVQFIHAYLLCKVTTLFELSPSEILVPFIRDTIDFVSVDIVASTFIIQVNTHIPRAAKPSTI